MPEPGWELGAAQLILEQSLMSYNGELSGASYR